MASSSGIEQKFKGDLREHLHLHREGIICQGRLLHFFILHNAQLSWHFSKLKGLAVLERVWISKMGMGLWIMPFNSWSLTYHLLPTTDVLFIADNHKT